MTVEGSSVARTTAPPLLGEAHFRLLVEQVVDYAMYLLDPAGRVATWNAGAERIKGYAADEIIGQHFSRFYPEEDIRRGAPARELDEARRNGRFEDEGWRIRKDGSRFWASFVLTALRDEEGRYIGFANVTRDLTERRRAEEERVHLEQRLAAREAAERMLSLLHRLHALGGALAAAESPAEVVAILVDEGGDAIDASTGVFAAYDDGELEIVCARGLPGDINARWHRFRPDRRTLVGQTFLARKAQWIESPEELRERVPDLGPDLAPGASAAALPLVVSDRVLGILSFRFERVRVFAPEERGLLEAMAAHAAQALERAHGYAREVLARASLTTTLRSIGDAVIATDAKGAVTMTNAVAQKLTGWTEAEARGRPLSEVFRVVDEETGMEVPSPVDKVLALGSVVGLASHGVLVARDGRSIPIDDSGAPIRARETDAIEGVVLVFRDITAQKTDERRRSFLAAATAALAESLDYDATVAKVAGLVVPHLADWSAVDVVDDEGNGSKRLASAHVDPQKLALAKELDDRYPPARAASGLPSVLRTGRAELHPVLGADWVDLTATDAEHRRLLAALGPRSMMIVPLVARGRVVGAITLVLTESGRRYGPADLELAEELARRCALAIDNARLFASEQRSRESADVANRAKDEFLAIISHELRTPLNAILGWARMLATSTLPDHRRIGALETIERNAIAMAQLIEDLLDMSRVVSGRLRIEVQRVDLLRVVEAALESIRPAADVKNIRIATALPPAAPVIVGDPTRLQQVVWNLLSNAVKFTPRDGRVAVTLGRAGASIELVVSDDGKGIDPQFLPHVFDAFRQEDASYTRSRGGLGLGLAITRQLVELHGGRIAAESEGEGKGATFRVVLPNAPPLPPAPSSTADAETRA